jgi:hypothetical protein
MALQQLPLLLLALMSCSMASNGATIPWVLVPDETFNADVPLGGSADVPLLGIFPTEAGCREHCTAQPNCTQYTWNNLSKSGSVAAWSNRCYGRHDDVWELHGARLQFSGRRFSLPPLPPPPPPPGPVPVGVVSLSVEPGVAVNPQLFGYVLEEWTSPLNLTFNDTAGLALTEALHPGVLRYPSGTGANIWDSKRGRYVPAPGGTGYTGWERDIAPAINGLPEGTFSAASFLAGFGGKVRRVLWNLNVYTFNATQTCDQIRYIAGLPGQQEPGVLLELGNELAQSGQGLPRFPNGTAYAEAMVPVVACVRTYMPHAVS